MDRVAPYIPNCLIFIWLDIYSAILFMFFLGTFYSPSRYPTQGKIPVS